MIKGMRHDLNHKPMEVWEAMELLKAKPDTVTPQWPGAMPKAFTDKGADEVRRLHFCHKHTYKELAARFNVSINTIGCVLRRRGAYAEGR